MDCLALQTLDIQQSAEWLGPSKTPGHARRSGHQQLVAHGRSLPGVQELQLSSHAGNSAVAMPPGY